ncbi:MAG: hypothetical protein E6R14_10610 [Thermomicrobiales bacterium]|nr:MAG: hypothetical protein E6R14_10610 [Thermomicrobiales bacterium]
MQKSMRYHIADGENQPVVRAVALVVQRPPAEPAAQQEHAPQENPQPTKSPAKSRWLRPALRKAHLASF